MKPIYLIIKQTVNSYWVCMQGHFPNERFLSTIASFKTYREAWDFAWNSKEIVSLLGHDVKLLNDKSAEEVGNAFCETMAFTRLEVLD